MAKSPERQFFKACYEVALAILPNATYDHKPLKDVAYPFIEFGEVYLTPRATKSAILGQVSLTIHVFADKGRRVDVSDTLDKLFSGIRSIRLTESLLWHINLNDCHTRVIQDTSTNDVLYHGILEITADFFGN